VVRTTRLLLVLLLATPMVLATAPACQACSCAPASAEAALAGADIAFVGEVISQREAFGGTIQVLRVDGVFKGHVGPRLELFASIGGGVVSDCAILLPTGGPVAVIARRDPGGRWVTDACSMTTERALRTAAGPPRPPDAASPSPTPAAGQSAGSSEPLPGWLVAVLGGLGGVALMAAWVAWGRRPRRPHEESPDPAEPSLR